MHREIIVRILICLALPLPASQLIAQFCQADTPAESATNKGKETVITGKVVAISERKLKSENDEMLLKTETGQEILLENHDGARLFFLDSTVRNRRVRLRLLYQEGKQKVSTINVEIENEGRWRVPQYYCDVCTIAVRYPQICLCCQGPMEFRFKPER